MKTLKGSPTSERVEVSQVMSGGTLKGSRITAFQRLKHDVLLRVTGSNSPRGKPSKKQKSAKLVELPDLRPWPEINLSDITNVTKEVLARVAERDDQNAFSMPVVEAYPQLLDDYTTLINDPMDLRTIEEERMHTYTSIQYLQRDLILMYRNCCTFNGEGNSLGEYAIERWRELNDIFANSCKSLKVLLPRRWKP
jgi:hypothetical protein